MTLRTPFIVPFPLSGHGEKTQKENILVLNNKSRCVQNRKVQVSMDSQSGMRFLLQRACFTSLYLRSELGLCHQFRTPENYLNMKKMWLNKKIVHSSCNRGMGKHSNQVIIFHLHFSLSSTDSKDLLMQHLLCSFDFSALVVSSCLYLLSPNLFRWLVSQKYIYFCCAWGLFYSYRVWLILVDDYQMLVYVTSYLLDMASWFMKYFLFIMHMQGKGFAELNTVNSEF